MGFQSLIREKLILMMDYTKVESELKELAELVRLTAPSEDNN
jgi:hypothetical protein